MILPDPLLYDPEQIEPYSLLDELNRFRLLCIFDQNSQLTDIEKLLKQLSEAFSDDDPLSIIIYMRSGFAFEKSLISQLEAVTELPDLSLIVEDPLVETELAAVFALCQSFFDTKQRLEYQWIACAMNVQALALPDSQLDPFVFSWQADPKLLRSIAFQNVWKTGLRGHFLAVYHQYYPENNWLSNNLSYLHQLEDLNVVEIIFWGRSGSSFLHSLLENHPETLSMAYVDFGEISKYPSIWAEIAKYNPKSFGEICELFCNSLSEEVADHYGLENYLFPKNQTWLRSNFEFFAGVLWGKLRLLVSDSVLQANMRKYIFCIFHYAYALAWGQNIQNKRWILHQMHWCEDTQGLLTMQADFPNLKLMGTIRHPVRGYYSLLSLNAKTYANYEDMVLDGRANSSYRHILMGWRMAERMMAKSVYAVPLEHLHGDPELVMKNIAQDLGISWSPNLLKSTINSYPFSIRSGVHGHVGEDKVFDLERCQYQHWQDNMHRLEAFALESLLAPEMETYQIEEVSVLQKRIGWIFVVVPTLLEIRAFQRALSDQSLEQIQQILLTYFERCMYAFLFICGYDTFYMPPILRVKPDLTEVKK